MRRWPWLWVGSVLFLAAGLAALLLPWLVYAALLAIGAVVIFWVLFPEAVILALILARSSVDGFMELFTFFPGSPLSMNLSGAVNSLAVGLGVLTLVRRMIDRRPLFAAGPGKAYALFLLACLLSIPGSIDLVSSVKEWARLASGLAIYLMVASEVHDEPSAHRFVNALMVSSLFPLAIAWFQKLTGRGYFFLGFVGTEFAFRPRGTFTHPASLGSYLIILLAVAVGLYFVSSRALIRASLLSWLALASGALVLTLARTQWLGVVIVGVVMGLLKRRWLALLVLATGVILLLGVPFLAERLQATESVTWRLDLWQVALGLARPLRLFGRGLATSPWYINQLLPNVDTPPHNDYLKLAVEMGVMGLLTYAAWYGAVVHHAWRAYRRAHSQAIAWRALAVLAVTVAVAVMSVTDNQLEHTAVQWYMMALVALVPAKGCWPSGMKREGGVASASHSSEEQDPSP